MAWCPDCEMEYDEDNETQPCCGACGYPINDYNGEIDEPDFADDFDDSEIYEEPKTLLQPTNVENFQNQNQNQNSHRNQKKKHKNKQKTKPIKEVKELIILIYRKKWIQLLVCYKNY